MATITVRNVPDDLHTALQEMAAANQRTLSQQAIFCIQETIGRRAMRTRKTNVDEIMATVRRIQAAIGPLPPVDEMLDAGENEIKS